MATVYDFNTAVMKALGLDPDKVYRYIIDTNGEEFNVIVWHMPDPGGFDDDIPEIVPTTYRLVPTEEGAT